MEWARLGRISLFHDISIQLDNVQDIGKKSNHHLGHGSSQWWMWMGVEGE